MKNTPYQRAAEVVSHRRTALRQTARCIVAFVGSLAVLSGCAATVATKPAPDANAPECADVSVRLPDAVGELESRTTDGQATAAWGDPTAVVFACGLEPPAPTTLQCVTINSVDWIVDDEELPNLRLTTYGREPAAQAYVDTTRLSADTVLQALAPAVQMLPKTAACSAPDEGASDDDDAPTTSGSGDLP
ncbi:DUF3515 family protein [Microbacterium sp. H83]|uniref:DUF3515 family protein n=1 Tax=Microbacterium sp. H83 TaxID=1827324 RepID=UPI001E45B259|nr:DUF3515 family protein [Microbacterium sp. H83]